VRRGAIVALLRDRLRAGGERRGRRRSASDKARQAAIGIELARSDAEGRDRDELMPWAASFIPAGCGLTPLLTLLALAMYQATRRRRGPGRVFAPLRAQSVRGISAKEIPRASHRAPR
jgi:uncharacterized protein (TIGR03382 family)